MSYMDFCDVRTPHLACSVARVHFLHLHRFAAGALRKSISFLYLYLWKCVNPRVTTQDQNANGLGLPRAPLGTASDVLTHPYTKSIVKLRWLKPRGGAPAVMRP